MKTDELAGAQLALWVALALKLEDAGLSDDGLECLYVHHEEPGDDGWWTEFRPHLDWGTVGPLLDRLMASGEWCIQPWDASLGIAPGCTVMISNYTLGGDSYDAHDVPVKHGNKAPRMDFITPTLLQAVCQATVASVYGPNVPNGAP